MGKRLKYFFLFLVEDIIRFFSLGVFFSISCIIFCLNIRNNFFSIFFLLMSSGIFYSLNSR